jgi:prephenate dehydrogenase
MNIGIIGLGLMGGSLGKAILKKTAHKVFGADKNSDTAIKAKLVNAISAPLTAENLGKIDILIVALNPRDFYQAVSECADSLKKKCIIIDICGIKTPVISAMEKLSAKYPHLIFVSTHPMAGREFYGINHAIAGLFEKCSVIIVPVNKDIAAMHSVKALFLEIGADEIVVTNAVEHDRIIAGTSQLPHLISSSYVTVPSLNKFAGFTAGSFRDLSRVAKMNAKMWTELILDNRKNVLDSLNPFIERLDVFKKALEAGNEDELKRLFEEGSLKKEEHDKTAREWKKNKEGLS